MILFMPLGGEGGKKVGRGRYGLGVMWRMGNRRADSSPSSHPRLAGCVGS